jgi:hypothetical protein
VTHVLGLAIGMGQLTAFALLTPPVIAKAQAFFFLNHLFTLSIESGSFYFFTDDAIQFPEGLQCLVFVFVILAFVWFVL